MADRNDNLAETLLALAERCEKAEGPDRRLDAEIGAAVRQMPKGSPDAWLSGWPLQFIAAPQFEGSIAAPNKSGEIVCHWEAPAYTASLDAAKSIWPEGWYIRVTQVRFGMWLVEGWRGDKSVKMPADVQGLASSEERARAAAALRARARGEEA